MKAETHIKDKGLSCLRDRHAFPCRKSCCHFLFQLLVFKCSLGTTTVKQLKAEVIKHPYATAFNEPTGSFSQHNENHSISVLCSLTERSVYNCLYPSPFPFILSLFLSVFHYPFPTPFTTRPFSSLSSRITPLVCFLPRPPKAISPARECYCGRLNAAKSCVTLTCSLARTVGKQMWQHTDNVLLRRPSSSEETIAA